MPKDLFFNLSEEKQESIFNAALEEFSNVEYMNASINKIVHNSGISRGSFYLYFEDKRDIYLFTTGKILENQSRLFLANALNKKTLDVFTIFRELFLFNMRLLSDRLYSQYFKNLYLGMDYDIWNCIRAKQKAIRENVYKQLSFHNMVNLQTEEAEALISILEMINRDMLTRKIFEDISTETILALYDTRIALIQNGVVLNKKTKK